MKRIGFTLAEVMIVLVIIGVITGILLPTAIQSTPDKNVMKFKKGYNTLGQVIRELVNSDKYYKDGDLGRRADNAELLDGTHEGDYTYFCETFADVLNIKEKNCSQGFDCTGEGVMCHDHINLGWLITGPTMYPNLETIKEKTDYSCNNSLQKSKEIVTSDNIIYYIGNSIWPFGSERYYQKNKIVDLTSAVGYKTDPNSSYAVYKVICMDIDGIDNGEDPFAFAIRVDGKIFVGARADEWINKSIQKGDE